MGFWDHVKNTESGCQIWTGVYNKRSGYGMYGHQFAHIHSLELSLGRSLLKGMWALHRCNNKCCVSWLHLYEGSAADNAQDRLKADGFNGFAVRKLTDGDVSEIKSYWSERKDMRDMPMSQLDLAIIFGVTRACICHIVSGRNWR